MKRISICFFLLIVLATYVVSAQEKTVGVIVNNEGVTDGYTLFSPQRNGNIYLIDNEGRIINNWTVEGTVREAHLLDNGNIMAVTGLTQDELDTTYISSDFFRGATGKLVELTWDGQIAWEYQLVDPKLRHHHGISILPNGNILMIVWSYRSIEEAIDMGLDVEAYGDEFDLILPDGIIEVDYDTKEIVWKWDTWDHLVQNFDPDKPNFGEPIDNPGRADLNYHESVVKGTSRAEIPDWLHSNAVAYNPELDQIAFSVRSFDEVWIIDHRITEEEAHGEAGDILYRWGNPFAYGANESIDDRFLYNQHDVQWVLDSEFGQGNIIAFNNREIDEEGNEYSAIIEFTPAIDSIGEYIINEETQTYEPGDVTWHYSSEGFYSNIISAVYRLPNGNTFVLQGVSGRMFEVTPDKELVWEYVNPETSDSMLAQGEVSENNDNRIFRARKYPADHLGFANHDLTPGDYLVEEDMPQ